MKRNDQTIVGLLIATTIGLGITPALAQPISQQPIAYTITVNSNQDTVTPDDRLTLREAIELSNGTLNPTQLSPTERLQITPSVNGSTIRFNLPTGQTTIVLTRSLPDLTRPVTLDGTTQPGYDATTRLFEQNADVRKPIVEITPAPGIDILRGLTITSDRVTVRGLSLYGFTSTHGLTASTPPADIFISHSNPRLIFQSSKSLPETHPLMTSHRRTFSLNKTGWESRAIETCPIEPPPLVSRFSTARGHKLKITGLPITTEALSLLVLMPLALRSEITSSQAMA